MRIAVVTSDADALGGVLATAYRRAGGPEPVLVVVLPTRRDLEYPIWARGWVALRLFGAAGALRVVSAGAGCPVRASDRALGIVARWPRALCGAATRVVPASTLGDDVCRELAAARPDLLVSIGAPVIIGSEILAIARLGSVNVHNGRLPAYRGHFGTFWEVSRGERWAYVSIHEMTARVDGGRLVACDRIEVRDEPSFLDLLIRKKRRAGELLAALARDVEARQALPAAALGEADARSSDEYFGWPTLRDVQSFKWPGPGVAGAQAVS